MTKIARPAVFGSADLSPPRSPAPVFASADLVPRGFIDRFHRSGDQHNSSRRRPVLPLALARRALFFKERRPPAAAASVSSPALFFVSAPSTRQRILLNPTPRQGPLLPAPVPPTLCQVPRSTSCPKKGAFRPLQSARAPVPTRTTSRRLSVVGSVACCSPRTLRPHPLWQMRSRTSAGGASASPAMGLLPSLRSSSSRTGSLPPASPPHCSAPSTSYSQGVRWNGPGLHRFSGMANLLQTIRGQRGIINDACDDPCRPDFSFFVVSRRQYLEMASRARALHERFWLGYKENYYEMSKEKRISTLKVNDNTFLWRHEVSGSRLLRRRISLDSDMGPFEDDSRVFYILQYHKLPRMKKEKKAAVLAERARQGYF